LFEKAESSKKVQGELGKLSGVYVNSGPSDIRALDFLLPAFESGIRCSCNGALQ